MNALSKKEDIIVDFKIHKSNFYLRFLHFQK